MPLEWWSPHPRLETVAGEFLLWSFLGTRGAHTLEQLNFISEKKYLNHNNLMLLSNTLRTHLLCVRHYSKYFPYMNSLKPPTL